MAIALIPCPQCKHMISPKAQACPQCGHPVKANGSGSFWWSVILFVTVIAGLIWVVNVIVNWSNELSASVESEKANPTCATDYAKCKDNAELVSRYMTKKDKLFITVACKSMAKKIAKYGEPELPFFAFGNYPPGRSFIDSGKATLLEPDAGYKNAFNATEKVLAKCNYDLKNDVASVELIRP